MKIKNYIKRQNTHFGIAKRLSNNRSSCVQTGSAGNGKTRGLKYQLEYVSPETTAPPLDLFV